MQVGKSCFHLCTVPLLKSQSSVDRRKKDSVKRIIEGRPKAKDLDKCTGIIRKYYHILKEKLKMKERNDFYN